jgi:hypothetical protein
MKRINYPNTHHLVSLFFLCAALLAGCVTTSGNYIVTATNAQGQALNAVFHVQGRHIYTARNGICAAHPGATVTIRVRDTGEELDGESPYRCAAQ